MLTAFWSLDGRTIVYSSAQGGLPRLARRELIASVSQYLLPESEGGFRSRPIQEHSAAAIRGSTRARAGVGDWCAQQDSNLRPSAPEADALSN